MPRPSNVPDAADAMAAKREKAERYAQEQERFHLESFHITMRSEHGTRHIRYDAGSWSCTCDFFASHETCSHVMAARLILGAQARLHLHDDH